MGFFLKVYIQIILAVNLILAVILIAYPYQLDRTYISIEHVHDFYSVDSATKYSTLIIGDSSAAYGLDPRRIPNSVSLAVPASTSIDLWLELNRYLALRPAPKCLLFFTSYIESNFKVGFLEKHAEASLFPVAAAALALQEANSQHVAFPEGRSLDSSIRKIETAPFLTYSAWRQFKIGDGLLSFLPNIHQFRELLDEANASHGNIAARGTRRIFDPARHDYLLRKFESIEFDDFFFRKMIEKSAAVGMKSFFIELPVFNPQHLPAISDFAKAHALHVQKLMESTRDGRYLEVSVEFGPADFFDTNHLNVVGSKRFSEAVAELLPEDCRTETPK